MFTLEQQHTTLGECLLIIHLCVICLVVDALKKK